MANIADQWDLLYKAGDRGMYRVKNPRRFFRLTKRFPISYILERNLVRTGDLVLEVGCGGGQYGIAFAVCGYRVILLDYSMETLKIAENNTMTAKEIQSSLEVKIVQGDMFNLGFSSGSFSMVFNEGALEHFASSRERIRCISEMIRVTKASGHIMIMIPNNCHPWVPYWIKHDFPWLRESNPIKEHLISAETLKKEMMTAGCRSVYIDGYEVYDSLQKWPKSKLRTYAARGLKFVLPEPPRSQRVKYGTYLFSIGTV